MSAEPDVELGDLGRALITDAGVAPAAVLAAAGRSPTGWRFAVGAAGVLAPERYVAASTPFDLASVTKPVVAATVARLVRRGIIAWGTPLGAILPELKETASGGVPIELLLAHRAGLDAHRAVYLGRTREQGAEMVREAAEARRPECVGSPPPEGFPALYSDLGYLLVGAAVSRAASLPLETVIAREVTEPLGLDLASADAWARRRAAFLDEVAPTEVVPWRGGTVVGAVHDENAWVYAGGAVAGHAGLFGTAESVARFGAAVVDALAGRATAWLGRPEALVLTRPRPGGTLRAGFDGRAATGSAAGSSFGPRSFGHLGFTGTSLWCDPDPEVVAVILTNRVHPTRDNIAIRGVRPTLHDGVFSLGMELRVRQ
jgi:CubicO group peptidase (beta-lactamase class C family)